MRYDAEHKTRTRERVLTVAKETIRRDGLTNLGVVGVMREAGLTHGGFYAHFASRDALLGAAIEEMLESARIQFRRVTDGLPPAAALAAYLDMYLSSEHRDSTTILCPLPVLSADMTRLDPHMRAVYGLTADRLAGFMRPMILASDPDIADGDALIIARSVVSEIVGALSLSRAIGPTEQSDSILAASRSALKRRLGLTPDSKRVVQ